MKPNPPQTDHLQQITNQFHKSLTINQQHQQNDDNDDDDYDSDDFEFFAGAGDLTSPVSADDVFHDGQIRPIFPQTTSHDAPVRKLFVASASESTDGNGIMNGAYCEWSQEKSSSPAPEMSRKSNSTGLSKLWKIRDLLIRSHSDGKDAFVFLGEKNDGVKAETTSHGEKKKKKGSELNVKVKKGGETASSAYEVLYGKRERKVVGNGKSYLPYRVGFFTNASGGMTRNVHPY